MTRISIICPTLNEEKHIAAAIDSFTGQHLNGFELEILVVDGMSTDRTCAIVEDKMLSDPRISLLKNPNRKTPYAFNIGIQNATGDFIAILGAHSRYDADYLQVCHDELKRTGSAGCSGRIRLNIEGTGMQAFLVRWMQSSSFGVSSKSFKTLTEGYTEIINFPVYIRSVILETGGYDTNLHRNQDNDLNQRIVAKGYKLYQTAKTGCEYTPPQTLSRLFRYAYRNGFWNAKSMLLKPRSMKLHHVIPFIFVCSLIVPVTAGIAGIFLNSTLLKQAAWISLFSFSAHLITGIIYAIRIAIKERKIIAMALPLLFLAFHVTYGWGTVMGFFKEPDE